MKKILNILFLMVLTVSLSAQTTLTFVGKDRTGNDYVQLSRVSVFDLDQLWHQEIYYPDTTLVLYVNGMVGVETFHETSLQMQNNPNPFDGTTDVILSTPYDGDVTMEITDVNGRTVVETTHALSLPIGTHQFRLTLSAPGTYVLTARQNGHTVSVKMVNAGNGGNDRIEYVGFVRANDYSPQQPKSGTRGNGNYPFHNGDHMRYIGYAMVDNVEIESETIQDTQNGSETIPLKFDVARPEVVTNNATNISATAATLNGEVTADNNASVTERGFCYGTGNNPSLNGTHVAVGDGEGTFSTQVGGLSPATNYNVRAYATNMVGTSYGQQKSFRTLDTLPVVTTTEPSNITATTFTSGGVVTAINSSSLTARGICWNTIGTPTIADSHTTLTGGLGSFTSTVTGLDCGTTYYVRAYATNSAGTAYGEEFSVTTTQELAQVITANISDITDNSAVCGGEVYYDGCSEVTARGVCWNTTGTPTIADSHTTDGNGMGDFTSHLMGLNYATTYYVRAYATNGVGTAYDEELSFTTQPILPTVTTTAATDITATSFICGGDVTNDGGAEVTARGICWSANPNPTIADNHTTEGGGLGTFTSNVNELSCGTTYYVRAYATNSVGTAYGEEYPVTTLPPTIPNVVLSSATIYNGLSIAIQAEVINENCSAITERGVCWSTATVPTVNDYHTNNGNGLGIFSDTLTGLETATTYYIRAYATNESGTAYSEQEIITTPDYPNVTTTPITDITSTTAASGGNVTSDGGGTVTARGVCWSTSQNPTIADNHITDGNGTGSFTSSITGLASGATYYVRAYATNSVGTAYGEEKSFTTLALPTVTTTSVTAITSSTATSGGNVSSDGGATVTARGVCWSTSHNPTISGSHTSDGTGTGSFTSNLTGLTTGTTYYVRAYATNSVGTAYGEEVSFTTLALPTITTTSVTDITFSTATSGGNVTSDGGATVSARGVCWSTSHNPTVSNSHTTNGTGSGSFTSILTGLAANTSYYVRAYATNSVGTSYGNEVSLSTPFNCGTSIVTDRDGNTYSTVQIGSQCWMKANLRTTKYADGTSISQGSSTSTTTAYWYYPNNNSSNKPTYGLLYNWQAVMRNASSSSANPSGVQGICPTGWHVPSRSEWDQLTNYVSSQSQYVCGSESTNIGKALADKTGWNTSSVFDCAVGNTPSNNNATGFSALPAGGYASGEYFSFREATHFWSTTSASSQAYDWGLSYISPSCGISTSEKNYGRSVRCVKD